MTADEQRYRDIDARLASLEADRDRALAAARQAVEMLFQNPVASAMLPKAVREGLKAYLASPESKPCA